MSPKSDAGRVVLAYIKALDDLDYETAGGYLTDGVRVKGPAGESLPKPKEFIDMLRQYKGKYDIKKVFEDEGDVCVLYDLATPGATVFTCSWYRVKDGKIASIHTVFDPRPFAQASTRKG